MIPAFDALVRPQLPFCFPSCVHQARKIPIAPVKRIQCVPTVDSYLLHGFVIGLFISMMRGNQCRNVTWAATFAMLVDVTR